MEFDNLLALIKTVSDSQLTGFKYEENGVKIQLSKQQGTVQVVAAETTAKIPAAMPAVQSIQAVQTAEAPAASQEQPAGNVIECPLVGTFYAAPEEGAPAFVSVGDKVKKGQTLAIVEAMKLMNEIESDFDGTVSEVLVENGQAVEYGQPLFRIC